MKDQAVWAPSRAFLLKYFQSLLCCVSEDVLEYLCTCEINFCCRKFGGCRKLLSLRAEANVAYSLNANGELCAVTVDA